MIRFVTVMMLMLSLPAVAHAQASREVELPYSGITLLGDFVVPDERALDGDVVLLTHGTLAHKDMELIEGLQLALAERGVASLAHSLSLAIDHRRGMYDCAQPHQYRHEDAVDEIAAWIDWLQEQSAGRVTLLGHSRGGNQVAWYASEAVDPLVAGVVLLAPATGASQQAVAARYRERFDADLAPVLNRAAALVAAEKDATLMSVPGFLYCEGGRAAAASVVSFYGAEPRRDTPALIPAITAPVLVIAGSADRVVPDVADRIRPLVDGEKVRLAVVEDADHMFLDFYLEDAAGLIVDFLRR